MKEDDQLKSDGNKLLELPIYKPDDQAYQKLHLCEYLRELYDALEEENEPPAEKKKD